MQTIPLSSLNRSLTLSPRPQAVVTTIYAAGWAASLIGAALLAVWPTAGHAQTLNGDTPSFTGTITVEPAIRMTNPAPTLDSSTLRLAEPIANRPIIVLPDTAVPAMEANRPVPIVGTEAPLAAGAALGAQPTASASGLGRLVTPGNENAGVVVGRLGATARADATSLTVDFDGDGLINFEVAPGIVEAPTSATNGDGGAPLGGLVGRHVTMAIDTADRVLDGVINVEGVTPATTFGITDGTVVLGGHDPTRQPGHQPDGQAEGPADDEGAEHPASVCLDGTIACFAIVTPPTPDSNQQPVLDYHTDILIMLSKHARDDEGDLLSNYGNEEIW